MPDQSKRPKGVPIRIPAWAWKWLKWRTGKKHKPTPTPAPPPPPPKPKPKPFTPLKGCDYVAGPTPAQLKAAGIHFVCRYLSTPGNPKNLTAAEAKALHAAGISIVLVFETTGTTFLGGNAAGRHDATLALEQAKALGVPATVPIYFAIDTDPHGHESLVVAYEKGAASVLTAARTGVYGGLTAIDACHKAGACKWFWQTLAWSGTPTVWHPANHLEQHENGAHIDGHSVDLDRAVKPAFGAWRP